jgi:hypothetical protein
MTSPPEIPSHLVEMVMGNIPPPYPDAFKRPLHVRRMAQEELIHELLKVVWANAVQEGMKIGLSIATKTKYMIVTAEQMEKIKNDPTWTASDA